MFYWDNVKIFGILYYEKYRYRLFGSKFILWNVVLNVRFIKGYFLYCDFIKIIWILKFIR